MAIFDKSVENPVTSIDTLHVDIERGPTIGGFHILYMY